MPTLAAQFFQAHCSGARSHPRRIPRFDILSEVIISVTLYLLKKHGGSDAVGCTSNRMGCTILYHVIFALISLAKSSLPHLHRIIKNSNYFVQDFNDTKELHKQRVGVAFQTSNMNAIIFLRTIH